MPRGDSLLASAAVTLLVLGALFQPGPNPDTRHPHERLLEDGFQAVDHGSFHERILSTTNDASCDFSPVDNEPEQCHFGNCTYCSFSNCWKRVGATFQDSSHCNSEYPDPVVCPEIQDPLPLAECPHGLKISLLEPFLDAQVQQGVPFTLRASLDLGTLQPVLAPCSNGDQAMIPHSNAHGCVRSSTKWWCRDIVPAYQPETVTNSPAICGNSSTNDFVMNVETSSQSQPNEWTIYSHFFFYTQENETTLSKWHITLGSTYLVQGQFLGTSRAVDASMAAIASITLLFPVLTYALALTYYRDHWVIKAASFMMCQLIVFGGALGAISVFAFIPSILTDGHCLMRQWLIPLAFDFMVLPMMLKTWRVYKLFNSSMKRVTITNMMLLKVFSFVILFELVFNLIWTLVPQARIRTSKHFSSLDPNAFEIECIAESHTAQTVFTALSIVIHIIPCTIATVYAYRVRLSFKYAAVNRKFDVFDESLYIMMALLDMVVVGLFVIVFQSVIYANPNAVTVMRCTALAWIAAFTVFVLFTPKFVKIRSWDPEKDKLHNGMSTKGPSRDKRASNGASGAATRGSAVGTRGSAAGTRGSISGGGTQDSTDNRHLSKPVGEDQGLLGEPSEDPPSGLRDGEVTQVDDNDLVTMESGTDGEEGSLEATSVQLV